MADDLKAMDLATVPKIVPVPVLANVIAEPADLLPAAVAVEKHKAVVLKVADKLLPDAVPVDKGAGKAVLAAGNEAPVVRVADKVGPVVVNVAPVVREADRL